jgi:hypothetical protein
MAKMFYNLEEAANRLGKTPDEVRAMAAQKVLTEFRDGDRLIFKVAEVDLLAPDTDDDGHGMIPLADSSEQSSLGLADTGGKSGSGPAIGASASGKTGTGISVFDIGEVDETDPSAATMVTEEPLGNVNLESFGSGSGLMDLTRESDDTSLGAEGLLDDLYSGDEAAAGGAVTESGLFEGASAASSLVDDDTPVAVAGVAESLDPKWSGLTGGMSIGVVVAAALGLAFVMMGVMGAAPAQLANMMGDMTIIAAMGIMLVVVLIGGGLGFFLGGK